MHIPRLKKGKSLSSIVSPVNLKDHNTSKNHKLLSTLVKSKDFPYKSLKVVENNKKTNFPYIGYFSCRKGKGETQVDKQILSSGTLKTLNKVLKSYKKKEIENKPSLSNEMGMFINSIFSKDLLPDIQVNSTPKTISRDSSTAGICAMISNNSRSTTIKTSSVEKIQKEVGKSATNSFIKFPSKKYSIKPKIHVKDPYHISNIMKNPCFTPFSSLLDCNTDPIFSGFNYVEANGNSNKCISLSKKVFEQERLLLKNDYGK